MQHTATHFNTLQHTGTHFETLQHTATHCNNTLQHTAAVWQRTATHYTTLQLTVTHCNTLQHNPPRSTSLKLQHTLHAVSYHTLYGALNLLQHAATHFKTLQRTATHCNKLQQTATHCNIRNTLLHTATHCNHTAITLQSHCNHTVITLQRTATYCNTLQHTRRVWRALAMICCTKFIQHPRPPFPSPCCRVGHTLLMALTGAEGVAGYFCKT